MGERETSCKQTWRSVYNTAALVRELKRGQIQGQTLQSVKSLRSQGQDDQQHLEWRP